MPAYPDHGARRRPRDAPQPPQYGHPQQQYGHPHHDPHVHNQPQKRRDTADSSTAASALKRPRVRFTPPLEAPLLSQVATMSGFLRKQADNEPGKWTKYYFVLKPTTYLYYYTSQHDAEPRGILDLEFLRDVRFNADCVQRSVGGGPHGFRVTGQLPTKLCPEGKDPNKTQFRPVYLDADSRDQADAWMEALRHHRFDLERHRDYDDLLDSMDECEERLSKLTAQAKELAATTHRTLRKGKELVCKLRGVAIEDDLGRPRGMSHHDEDIAATVQSIGVLLDEMFAEADRQRRLAELLRQREDEAVHNNSALRECEAELQIQTTRCERLASELEALREEQRVQKQGFDTRYAELVTRERELIAREKEMLAQIKDRERLCDQRMQEVDQKSSKWTKELEKEAAKKNAELEKRRKALEKQQKALDLKQKQLDKRLQETAPPKMRFVGAIGKSRTTSAVKEEPADEMQDDAAHDEHEDDTAGAAATRTAKSRGRFGFLGKRGGNHTHEESATEAAHKHTEIGAPSAAHYAPTHESEMESDSYDDSGADLPYRENRSARAATSVTFNPDRSSDASTTRLSGVSYSSSVSTQYPRSTRSMTTGAVMATNKKLGPSRSASVPASSSEVYAGMHVRLPPEWTYKESKKYQGRLYYYNRVTGETRWEFPYDVVVDNGYAGVRDSNRSSFDDGNDFVSSSEPDREDIGEFLSRTRANTYRPTPSSLGAASSRSRFQSTERADTSWESRYYSDAAMASRMGFVPEEPEDEEMHTIDEEEPSTATGKSRLWGRKLPKMRGKSSAATHDVEHATTKSIAHDPSDEASSHNRKGWKLMPKFGKGSKGKAAAASTTPPPHPSPCDTDPIVHDNGRCEF